MNLRLKLLGPLLLVSASAGAYLYGVWSPTAMRQAEEAQLDLIARHVDSVGEALVAPMLSSQLAMIHDTLGALQKKNQSGCTCDLVNMAGQQLYPLLGAQVQPDRLGSENPDGAGECTRRTPGNADRGGESGTVSRP